MSGAVDASEAATVLLLRDAREGIEVHLQRRRAELEYGARAFVFPGGSLDAGDVADDALALVRGVADIAARAARMELDGDERLCGGLHLCAVREVFEESGILLAHRAELLDAGRVLVARERVLADRGFAGELRALGVAPAVDELVYVARFVTPLGFPRRFDTRFFAVRTPDGQSAAIHAAEADSGAWFAPGDLLALADAGSAVVMPPTRVMLAELTLHGDVASVLADLGSREVCGILFSAEMARQTPPDHLPTVTEVEAMGARATPERLAGREPA